ncbi:protease pro-enzyme activation domain-containing protein [Dictyobacter kobayashii]|uniref:Peptidase S53 activation domain-containing protein n=1 Tax=Dictyobacter kobayashii TaxID=2014872 RepID=A0A402AM31_9CHLR|nr:protease pro-enzyme activation domain-containing protein [Dictyobacter kobayashii]GCE20176.1 hypothetical protein KDK_39760 [Dictyobacter kobayashii]
MWHLCFTMIAIVLLPAVMIVGMFNHVSPTLAAPLRIHAQYDRIPGHVIPVFNKRTPIGPKVTSSILNLSISLVPRNKQLLDTMMADQNNPLSPRYHHYLTPQEFKAQFGPTQQTVANVTDYLRRNGFHVISIAPNNMLLKVSATVGTIENTFQIVIYNYVVNTHIVYAPSTNPAVPAVLSPAIQFIAGLDNVVVYQPRIMQQRASRHMGPNGGIPLVNYVPRMG